MNKSRSQLIQVQPFLDTSVKTVKLSTESQDEKSKDEIDEENKDQQFKVGCSSPISYFRLTSIEVVFFFIGFGCIGLLFSAIFNVSGDKGNMECIHRLDPTWNNSIVTTTLMTHCNCIPLWMGEGVYFDPVVTLLLAILAVLAFITVHRFRPLVEAGFSLVWGKYFGKSTVDMLLAKFQSLPSNSQEEVQISLKLQFDDMPNIISILNNLNYELGTNEKNIKIPPVTSNNQDDIFIYKTVKSAVDDIDMKLKVDIDAMSSSDLVMFIKELKVKLSKPLNDCPTNHTPLESPIPTSPKDRESSPSLISVPLTNSMPTSIGSSSSSKIEVLELKPPSPCSENMPIHPAPSHLRSVDRDLIAANCTSRRDVVDWFTQGDDEKNERKEAFIVAMFTTIEAQCEASEREDNVAIFAIQLLIGIVVLLDYFIIQERPVGVDWHCQWVYFSAVVMYKPFTIPMWFSLTMCCHYSFADRLYKDKKRNIKAGTPYGAPFERSYITIFMIFIVTTLQSIWLLGTIVIVLPLMLIFSPVVILPSFIIPATLIILQQKCYALIKRLSLKARKSYSQFEVLNMTPTPFNEIMFILKAVVTQLVSVCVLCFLLLPFYDKGSSWWSEGANIFLFKNFDLPNLPKRFSYTLSWPEFEQPRLDFQLQLGLTVISIQIVIRIFKRFIINQSHYFKLNELPGKYELLSIKIFSYTSWLPFRGPMDAAQTALEVVMSRIHSKFIMWFYNYKYWHEVKPYAKRSQKLKALLIESIIFLILGLPLFIIAFCYFIIAHKRIKEFGVGTNNIDLYEFINLEDCMTYTHVYISEGSDVQDLTMLMFRCPWIEITHCRGTTPFMTAAMGGQDKVVSLLLDKGTDVNHGDKYNTSALLYAAIKGQIKVVVVLLDAGANVDHQNEFATTPLMQAAKMNHGDVVTLLLDKGANIDLVNKDGRTPLMWAAIKGQDKIIQLLLDAGANVHLMDKDGDTALELAREKGFTECERLLNGIISVPT